MFAIGFQNARSGTGRCYLHMPIEAFALALAAAFLHALWNVLLARTRDPQAATAVAFCVAVVVWAPVAAARWRVEAGAWPYVAGSAVFELVYVLLLGAAYARAPLSVFYPLARGLAPVLVLAVAVLALGAATSWLQGAGVCAVAVGVLLIRGRRARPQRPRAEPGNAQAERGRAATLFGLSIAATIAGYTLIDNSGVVRADPLAYLELVMVGPAVLSALVVGARSGRAVLRAGLSWETVLIAPLTLAPYALALFALRIAAAAPVAAVRECSVLIAVALAALLLGERVSAWHAAGAAAVVAGITLLAV
jgi:drug/metabolite transporter (DMT)-like permease